MAHIHIIEDNLDDLFFIRRGLDKIGLNARVTFSANGYEAAELLSKTRSKPDFILSDFSLKGLNGLEIFSRLKLNPDYKDIPFVILSGVISDDQAREAHSLGIRDCLEKHEDLAEQAKRIFSYWLKEKRLPEKGNFKPVTRITDEL